MSNKYRARRRKMQSPAVCKKSGPGPVKIDPRAVDYPNTEIMYATVRLPVDATRFWNTVVQLVQLRQQTNGLYTFDRGTDATGWNLSVRLLFAAPNTPPILDVGTGNPGTGEIQQWQAPAPTDSEKTFSTRLLTLLAGFQNPATAPAYAKAWR